MQGKEQINVSKLAITGPKNKSGRVYGTSGPTKTASVMMTMTYCILLKMTMFS